MRPQFTTAVGLIHQNRGDTSPYSWESFAKTVGARMTEGPSASRRYRIRSPLACALFKLMLVWPPQTGPANLARRTLSEGNGSGGSECRETGRTLNSCRAPYCTPTAQRISAEGPRQLEQDLNASQYDQRQRS